MPSVSLLLGSEVRCRQLSRCFQMFFGLLHAAGAAGAVISKVASTTMPNTNCILPCVIAIFLCPNSLRPRTGGPGEPRGFLFLSVHRGAPKREPRRSYRGR